MSILTSAGADYTICTIVINLHQRNTEIIIFAKLKICILSVNFCEQNNSPGQTKCL